MPERNGSYSTDLRHSVEKEGGFTVTYVTLPDDVLRRVARLASRKEITTNELIREMVSREVDADADETDESTVATR